MIFLLPNSAFIKFYMENKITVLLLSNRIRMNCVKLHFQKNIDHRNQTGYGVGPNGTYTEKGRLIMDIIGRDSPLVKELASHDHGRSHLL